MIRTKPKSPYKGGTVKDRIIWRVLFPLFFIAIWVLALGATIGWFDLSSIYIVNKDNALFFEISIYVYTMITIVKWMILVGGIPIAIMGFCGGYENLDWLDEKPRENNGQENFYD